MVEHRPGKVLIISIHFYDVRLGLSGDAIPQFVSRQKPFVVMLSIGMKTGSLPTDKEFSSNQAKTTK